MKETYEVSEYKVEVLKGKLESLNRKAQKIGCAPITMTLTGNHRDVELLDRNTYGKTGVFVRLVEVVVEGETPKIKGWEFIATLQHEGAGNILRKVPGTTLPKKYQHVTAKCDHCQTERRRNDTYVLHNVDSDEYKQVGSTCLRDFTGANNPHHAAQLAAGMSEFIEEFKEDDFDGYYDPGQGGQYRVSIERYLSFVACMIRNYGWKSRGRAYEEGTHNATADLAATAMFTQWKRDIPQPEACDELKALTALEWGRATLEAKSAAGETNDYEWNLFVAISEEAIEDRTFGIAASLLSYYERAMAKEREAKNVKVSEHVGEIKERVTFEHIVVVMDKMIESNSPWGNPVLYKFNADGNEIVWFASGWQEFESGDVVSGKATIKAHDVYNGRKQTIITRAKFEKN